MPQPLNPGSNDESPPPSPERQVRWKDVRFNGALICRVNADDPTHVQVMANVHHGNGKRRIFEVSTTAGAVTGM